MQWGNLPSHSGVCILSMTIYIRDAIPIQRVFIDSLRETSLYDHALSLGLMNVYRWCVAKAFSDVYLLDIWENSYYGKAAEYSIFYDAVSDKLIRAIGDEFEVTQKFINKRVGISHKDTDLLLFSIAWHANQNRLRYKTNWRASGHGASDYPTSLYVGKQFLWDFEAV